MTPLPGQLRGLLAALEQDPELFARVTKLAHELPYSTEEVRRVWADTQTRLALTDDQTEQYLRACARLAAGRDRDVRFVMSTFEGLGLLEHESRMKIIAVFSKEYA